MATDPIHILSLGAGVQSSTMALMAAKSIITPMPLAAIFADTGDEPQNVMNWLKQLEALLPFPVYRCQRSVLSEHILEWGHSQIPTFMPGSIGKRQCTKHWKIIPIQKECRRITGTARKRLPAGHFIIWHGISIDEATRMKDSRVRWIKHRWPLVELSFSRMDCLKWMKTNGYPEPPKSACVYCPYHRNEQWRSLKEAGGPDWEKVVRVSRILEARGEYLTSKCKPIDQCDFGTEKDGRQLNLFENECEGMCGV